MAKDGSGAFSAIQPAVDAASPGDTVFIAAGRYTEHAATLAWGEPAREACVVVGVDSLTLIGESPESVVVGPETYEFANWGPVGIGGVSSLTFIKIEGVGLVNNYFHIYLDAGFIEITGCRMQAGGTGVWLYRCQGGLVSGGAFEDCDRGIMVNECSAMNIESCQFLRASIPGNCTVQIQWSSGVLVSGCTIDEGLSGIDCYLSTVEISRTTIRRSGNKGIISYGSGANALIRDCRVLESSYAALRTDAGGCVRGERSIFQGGAATLSFRQGAVTLRDCHIMNDGGQSVLIDDDVRYSPGTYDLVGNWWGTTDTAQIDAWIKDANDNPHIGVVVQYQPVLDHPVGAQSQTLGGIKGMFR